MRKKFKIKPFPVLFKTVPYIYSSSLLLATRSNHKANGKHHH
jgi:hypothetical protein